jgi:hypothetical protein
VRELERINAAAAATPVHRAQKSGSNAGVNA